MYGKEVRKDLGLKKAAIPGQAGRGLEGEVYRLHTLDSLSQ